MILTIELVPSGSWFTNVRSQVSRKVWDWLRREYYEKAGYRCVICQGKGDKWPVECHEIWKYEELTHTQILLGLEALCPECHRVKHIGLAQITGRLDAAKIQLMKVNDLTRPEADEMVEEAFDIWRERSQHTWTLDLTWLEGKGIKYKKEKKL